MKTHHVTPPRDYEHMHFVNNYTLHSILPELQGFQNVLSGNAVISLPPSLVPTELGFGTQKKDHRFPSRSGFPIGISNFSSAPGLLVTGHP
jgi:hypothetical protein